MIERVWETSELNDLQRQHVSAIIEDCTFPWEVLLTEILVRRGANFIPVKSSDLSRFQSVLNTGEHHVHEKGKEGHLIAVGRQQVLGVFWTDGRIEIEQSISDPDLIKEIFLAEAAHSVDYFLPLSDSQKMEIANLFHPEGIDEHTWWEIHDYGAEYYSLIGESFMALFTMAYSNLIPWQDSFVHKATEDMIPGVYRILGVEPEIEEIEPIPEPIPMPESAHWFAELLRKLLEWIKSSLKS